MSCQCCIAVNGGVFVGCGCMGCFCVFHVFCNDGPSGRKRIGIALVPYSLQTKVRSWLVQRWGSWLLLWWPLDFSMVFTL